MKFGMLLLNQILSPGTPLQLRKPIYNSANAIYRYTTRRPTLHVELNSVKSPSSITDINKKIVNYLGYLKGKDEDS